MVGGVAMIMSGGLLSGFGIHVGGGTKSTCVVGGRNSVFFDSMEEKSTMGVRPVVNRRSRFFRRYPIEYVVLI
jgi:hypothetical protein